MSPFTFGMNPVDCNGAMDAALLQRHPEAVLGIVVSPEKLREFRGHLSLKEESESPVIVVVGAVKFGNPTDGAGGIALYYLGL